MNTCLLSFFSLSSTWLSTWLNGLREREREKENEKERGESRSATVLVVLGQVLSGSRGSWSFGGMPVCL